MRNGPRWSCRRNRDADEIINKRIVKSLAEARHALSRSMMRAPVGGQGRSAVWTICPSSRACCGGAMGREAGEQNGVLIDQGPEAGPAVARGSP